MNCTNSNGYSCLFLMLLVLCFSLSVTNVSEEERVNKTLPLISLIGTSVVMVLILLQTFGVKALKDMGDLNELIFYFVLGLSFVLSLTNVTNEEQENKSFSTIVLVVSSVVLLMAGFKVTQSLMK